MTDLSDLVSAVKGTGTPGAMALVGIYAGSTAEHWQLEFQWWVSVVALSMVCLSGMWFLGMFAGRLTEWPALKRLEGQRTTEALPPS